MKFRSNFKVTAPATIANLACGFDILGIALNMPLDEIIVKPIDQPGIHITSILNNKTKISPTIEENAAGTTAQLLLDHLKKEHGLEKDWGLDLKLNKKIGVGYGLGSSSASAVAGAMAVNEAFGVPLTKRELIPFIVQGELIAEKQFRINSLVPSLLGGLILTRDHKSLDFHRLPVFKGLHFVIIYPHNKRILHQEMRNNLSQKITVEKTIQQAANASALVQALYTADLELMARSLTDNIAESYWKDFIPFFSEIKATALKNNALGCSISGTGSGIFAICKNSLEAEQVAEAMKAIYDENKIRNSVIISQVNQEGATIS